MLTNEERKIFRQKALMNNGYYDRNGNWNAIKVINGNVYRDRVETLIIKDKEFVFIKLSGEKGKYKLPGGSLGKDITPETQAINECHEETHFEVSNIQSTGITYKINYPDNNKTKDNEYQYGVKYIGAFTSLFTAEYAGTYNGKIAEVDEDPYVRSGKWYTFKEAFGIFNQWHRDALLQYIKLNLSTEDYTTEGYLLNRLSNHLLLKSKNIQEIDRNSVEQMIRWLNGKYRFMALRYRKGIEPIGYYRLPLKTGKVLELGFAVDFDGERKIGGNSASATQLNNGGDGILLEPVFFKLDKDNQFYTMLHEIGHIRLKHTDPNNMKKSFKSDDDIMRDRIKTIRDGKVQYTELNADTYSILNGANRYNILSDINNSDSTISTLRNLENARRYDIVTRRKSAFDKRYGINESAEDELTTESYFTNWFSNELKLWSKEIRTDAPKEILDNTIRILSEAYKKHKNDPKYKKGLFVFSMLQGKDYKEGEINSPHFIHFCIDFSDMKSGPAYATATGKPFQIVVVTPEFFNMKPDTQKFVLLHEIGHIRLGHTKPENLPCDLFGNPAYSKARGSAILNHGKTIYTELNADLYAVLNGGKLYSLLDVAFDKDFDDQGHPYIYGNYEIADRYKRATERALRRDLYKGLPTIGR